MTRLNINIDDVKKAISNLEELTDNFKENYNRLSGSFSNLGDSWNDQGYEKLRGYINDAGRVLTKYEKEVTDYTNSVKSRIAELERDYLDCVGNTDIGLDLNDLNLNMDEVETELPNEFKEVLSEALDKTSEETHENKICEDEVDKVKEFLKGVLEEEEIDKEYIYSDTVEGPYGVDIISNEEMQEIENNTHEIIPEYLYYDLREYFIKMYVKDGVCKIPEGIGIILPLELTDEIDQELEQVGNEYMPGVFSNTGITKLILPSTMKKIGVGAFDNNNIEEMNLPEGLEEVKEFSFSRNRIKRLILPESIIYVGDYAFEENVIDEVKIPNSLVYIGDDAFGDVEKIIVNKDYPYQEYIKGEKYLSKVVVEE